RAGIQRLECGPPRARRREDVAARVCFRGRAFQPSAFLECTQDAAQITSVESERAAQIARGKPGAVARFVQDARLGQRERAVQEAFLEDADLARIEAVEVPDSADVRVEGAGGRAAHPEQGAPK